jgi:uncharacterized membrane protein YeiH
VLQTILNFVGIAAGAASGAVVGIRKGFDLFGIAVMAVVASGAAIAVDAGASWTASAILGMLTAITGGILRDVLARDVPMVMGPDDLYATPAILGAITYVVIDYLGPQWIGVLVGSLLATTLRLAAMYFHWRLPTGPRHLIVRDD